MSDKAIFVWGRGRSQIDGFTHWTTLPSGVRLPKRYWPELTAQSVGWRRFWQGSVVCETLRLPKGFRWLQTGSEDISNDGRDYTRRGLTDPDPTIPDVLGYTTAFTKSGHLYWYFIKKQGTGEPRIERVESS